MNRQLNQNQEFRRAFNLPCATLEEVNLNDGNLLVALIQEEVDELQDAINSNDKVEALDALVDIVYIVCGGLNRFGMAEVFQSAFDEVHRSNMSKLDKDGKPIINGENGVFDQTRPLGKVLKSELYLPPNLKQFIP